MSARAPIRAVLFDWGDTLFESPHAPTVIVAAARERGVALDADEARRIWTELWDAGKSAEEHAKGRDLSREAHRRVWTRLFSRANTRIPGIDRVLYERVMDPAGWVPYPDTEPTLRALKDRGVRVGIVSNHAYDLRPLFAAKGLADLIDDYALSFELGTPKPAPEIFRTACHMLGVEPPDALMVGDDAVSDGGAAAAGLRVHILPPHEMPGSARGLRRVVELVDASRT
ncbi:MAG TPA: HAD-IA family hydrolase [Candidatus Limnocylindria bacterium]|nr:HAD-IA family hydrolase [Candidatus Limnocylindria bacterium]